MERDSEVQFKWGKKCVGRQFYESFTFDNVEYSLYDCIHIFKEGEDEPYIGKIIEIWEHADEKEVNILWFLRPTDITDCLGDYVPGKKEVFLASGEGPGVSNVNKLEAIARKCSVICTSKDKRNPQPSKEAVESADYIFKCTFDVGSRAISHELGDKVAGVEVKYLLNREEQSPAPTVKAKAKSLEDSEKNKKGKLQIQSQDVIDGKRCARAMKSTYSGGNLKKKSTTPLTEMELKDSAVLTKKNKNSETRPIDVIQSPDKVLKDSAVLTKKNEKTETRPLDAIQRPNTEDRSKWFKPPPWETRMKKADEKGTLVYLYNFDISFASTDLQEIMSRNFNQTCSVKIIPHLPGRSPNYGEAYLIFQSPDEADKVVDKITRGILMQRNGRPLLASKGMLPMASKLSALPGHLSFEAFSAKFRKQQMGKRDAVFTSHCAQPNTIEYGMALEWLELREIYAKSYSDLDESQRGEIREQRKAYK